MSNQPDYQSFFAVIPFSILSDEKLSDGCKIFYALLSTLMKKEGFAWASNEYLSVKSNKSERTIQRWINQLDKAGHIIVEISPCNQKRKIFINTCPVNNRHDKNVAPGTTKMSPQGDKNVAPKGDKNVAQVYTEYSNKEEHEKTKRDLDIVEQKNCSTLSDDPEVSKVGPKTANSKKIPSPAAEIRGKPEKRPEPTKPDPPPRKVMYYDAVEEIIHYLNDATGRTFSSGADHSKFIRARLTDGHKIRELKDVIDLKAAEWTGDGTMEKYLRPQTLFNKTKFSGYLEELIYLGKKNKMLDRLKITVDNFVTGAGLELIWSNDEEVALYQLSKKINESNKKRGDPGTVTQINDSLELLLSKLPKFWHEKFSITKLNKFFNDIINEIRTSNQSSDYEWDAYVASFDQPQAGTA